MGFKVPRRDEVSVDDQRLFDRLQEDLGAVPNIHAALAHCPGALDKYMVLQGGPVSLDERERSAVALVVSQVNDCRYMLELNAARAATLGFTAQHIAALREGNATFDSRLDPLVRLARNVTVERGHADTPLLDNFAAAGYGPADLVDLIMLIGELTIGAYLSNASMLPFDTAPLSGAMPKP